MSQIRLSTYINFSGRAREALEFYHKVLGGTLDLRGSRLEVDGAVLIATEGHPNYPPTVGDNMAIALSSSDADRVTKVFSGLADGGTIKGPLKAQAGRGRTGYLVDRFGINWVVTIADA